MATNGMIAARHARRWQTLSRRQILLAVALVLGLSGVLALVAITRSTADHALPHGQATATIPRAPDDSPVPTVEPLELDASHPDEARQLNAEIPFSTAPNPAARPFQFKGDVIGLARATDCLASAMIYEAGDDTKGQRAVGQVVLNRLRHPAFPKTVCGVVFQGQERATGCQFTFTCDGAMARRPSAAAWERARGNASRMLAGDVFTPVGHSTHYHTDWVMPYWSKSLDKVTAVDTHLFFRWQGWWGTPGAFARQLSIPAEPAIAKLAALSPVHKDDGEALLADALPGSLINDGVGPTAISAADIGKRIGPGRLAAVEAGGTGFVMTLEPGGDPVRYAEAAARLCAGREQCRLLAWTSAKATPRSFPVAETSLASMSFSYLRNKESGIERILYNCDEFPTVPRVKCMVHRTPTGPAPKLLADEQSDKGRVSLPAGARLVADIQRGELVPLKREDAAMFVARQEPSAATRSGGQAEE
jgi:spore germination cell wall hydrolase CwlJ-like protein